MRDRARQFDMAHAFAPHLGQRHFHAAFIADDAFVTGVFVFAAVAFTPNLWLICGGVFIGILAMRFATTKFVKVLEKNPILEKVAYWVIGALGLKLVSSYWLHDLNTESIDAVFSILTLLAFIIPLIIKKK